MGSFEYEYDEPKIPLLFSMYGISGDCVDGDTTHLDESFMICDVFPICYRLSDLDKFIPELGFVPINELEDLFKINSMWHGWNEILKNANLKMIDFPIAQQLFQWHFWLFGEEYFESGLVIDKMTYSKETPTNP